MIEEILDNLQPMTPSDLHAIALLPQLSEREADVLFGDADDVSYEEYSAIAEKLIEISDFETALRLRVKYDAVVEAHADQIVNDDRDYTPVDPALTTWENIHADTKRNAEAFPEAYARVQEMIEMGQKHINELKKKEKLDGREDHIAFALKMLDKLAKGITPEDKLYEAGLEGYNDWLKCVDDVRKIIESDDIEASDAAIKKINDLFLFSRLNDKTWLASELNTFRRSIRKNQRK